MSKPRTFTPEFKAQMALAALTGDKPLATLCREFQVPDSVIARWKQLLLERTPELFASASPDQRYAEQVAELERVIGRLTVGLTAAEKVVADARLSVARRRELVAGLRDEFPLATLCRVRGLSPSWFHDRPHATDDTALRAAIGRLARESPRYGSRRITRMLRRERWRGNRKRVQQLIRESCLLAQIRRLVRTSLYRPGQGHGPDLLKTTAVTHPSQVWVGHIMYVRVRSPFVSAAVLMADKAS